MSKTLGMDFGTTNSGAAFHDGNQVHMIDLGSGRLQMPSVVALPPGTDPLLGRAALRYLEREKDPQFVYRSIKRKLGQRYIEGEDDGFQIVPDKEGFQAFSGPDESTLAPESLAALIMARLRRAAEEQTGETFTSVMVGVPYAAGPDQIAMTRLAASMAGFEEVSICTEPEAACYAHELDRVSQLNRALVYDQGGGTTDVALLHCKDGYFERKAGKGHPHLGGLDWDQQIIDVVSERYRDRTGRDIREARSVMLKIGPAAEAAKIELSEFDTAPIQVTRATLDFETGDMVDLNEMIDRAEFEDRCAQLMAESRQLIDDVLREAGRQKEAVDQVVLVGGMTRVPMVRMMLEQYFGLDRMSTKANPDHAVAIGCAIKGAIQDHRINMRTAGDQVALHAFGVLAEASGRENHTIIPKGSELGKVAVVPITNLDPGQENFEICLTMGEGKHKRDVQILRRVTVPLPADLASREVEAQLEFMLDHENVLMVTLILGDQAMTLMGDN